MAWVVHSPLDNPATGEVGRDRWHGLSTLPTAPTTMEEHGWWIRLAALAPGRREAEIRGCWESVIRGCRESVRSGSAWPHRGWI